MKHRTIFNWRLGPANPEATNPVVFDVEESPYIVLIPRKAIRLEGLKRIEFVSWCVETTDAAQASEAKRNMAHWYVPLRQLALPKIDHKVREFELPPAPAQEEVAQP